MTLSPMVHTDQPEPLVYGWDWSSTTHDARGQNATVREIVGDLVDGLGTQVALPVEKGLQGWSEHVDCFDGNGYRLGRVYFGGDRTDVHVVSTSEVADQVRNSMASVYGARTSRVDTRVDTNTVPFEDLADIIEQASMKYGSKIIEYRSRVRGVENGRTLYLGSPSSAIRVRLYEKWLESPGQYEDGTNRVEVQLRPPSRVKADVSTWTRAETFCASRVTQELADLLGADLVPAASLHVAKGTPDLERSLEAMGDQYGPSVGRWLALGGDFEKVIDYLLPGGSLRGQ